MQIQNTYNDRIAVLKEIDIVNDARSLLLEIPWFPLSSAETRVRDRVFDYLTDRINATWMIYRTLDAANAVAVADS